jgi:hypothetical protein
MGWVVTSVCPLANTIPNRIPKSVITVLFMMRLQVEFDDKQRRI